METREWADDPVQVYLREACNVPELSEDEETELSRHVLAKDRDAESAGIRLMEANLRMVVAVADRYRASDLDVLTLVQKGNDGLLVAVKTLPDNPGQRFCEYAAACVQHAIEEWIEKSRR